MGNLQTTKSTKLLIPCTNRDALVATDDQAFKWLLKSFKEIGGTVNKKTMFLIERSSLKNKLTVGQAEAGLLYAIENAQYRPTWADVLKGATMEKKGDQSIYRKLHD